MRALASLFITLALYLASGRSTSAADSLHRQVGVARIDVTPDYPVRMTGYSNRKREFEGVEQRLWAKALAIGIDADGPAVLITVDSLGVSDRITSEVAARLAKRHPITRERLVICASHTHSAPGLEGVAPMIFVGDLPPEHAEHLARYTAEMTDKLELVALAALADRRPTRLSWAEGTADFAVNRRRIAGGKVSFGITPYPAGVADHRLPVLRVVGPDDKLRAVLVNYACHCTTLGGDFNRVCGDWAGYAQEFIEREHPGTIALVSIGCGADANPQPREDLAYARLHGQTVARELNRLLAGTWKPIDALLTASMERFELPFDTLPTREEFEQRAKRTGPIAYHAKVNLERLARGEKLSETLPCQATVWRFGKELGMVFLAGEVVADYALRLGRELDGSRLWITAYASDDPCYIASKRVLAEGGYEVDGSMYYYDRPTHFAPSIEDRIITVVERLLGPDFRRP